MGIVVPDQVSPHRRADHVLLVHQMRVELVARAEQVGERKVGEAVAAGEVIHCCHTLDNEGE
jgi:hypothetical protein